MLCDHADMRYQTDQKVATAAGLSAIRGEWRSEMAEIQISLAAARVNAGLTQEEVAKKMHISKQTIGNWEKGKVIPGVPQMEMLSRMYGIPQDNIFLSHELT